MEQVQAALAYDIIVNPITGAHNVANLLHGPAHKRFTQFCKALVDLPKVTLTFQLADTLEALRKTREPLLTIMGLFWADQLFPLVISIVNHGQGARLLESCPMQVIHMVNEFAIVNSTVFSALFDGQHVWIHTRSSLIITPSIIWAVKACDTV